MKLYIYKKSEYFYEKTAVDKRSRIPFYCGQQEKLLRKVILEYEEEAIYCDAGALLEEKRTVILQGPLEQTEYGKPYLKNTGLEFSVSHSGLFLGYAVSRHPVGIDLQSLKSIDGQKLAKRFFTSEEQQYIMMHGKDSFFEIWARKEALIKCTGRGLAQGLSSFSTVSEGNLSDCIVIEGAFSGKYFLRSFHISPEIKCAVCLTAGKKEEHVYREVQTELAEARFVQRIWE